MLNPNYIFVVVVVVMDTLHFSKQENIFILLNVILSKEIHFLLKFLLELKQFIYNFINLAPNHLLKEIKLLANSNLKNKI